LYDHEEGSELEKFSDDTALLSLSQNMAAFYLLFVKWCNDHFFDLNVTKTKELIFDFRKNINQPKLTSTHGEGV